MMETTTVMPTWVTTSGAPNTIPGRVTSTPWPPLCTPVTAETDIGTLAIGGVARPMPSMWTRTWCAPRTGALSTPTSPSPSPTTRPRARSTSGWNRKAEQLISMCVMMEVIWVTWPNLMGVWSFPLPFGAAGALTWGGWTVWPDVEAIVILDHPVSVSQTLTSGKKKLAK